VNLKITYIQTSLIWENKIANLTHFETLFKSIKQTDLIVLPEMFTTGFTMNSNLLAEQENEETFLWIMQMAKEKNAAITGSFIVKEKNDFYNRLLWANPNGTYYTYNKRHLFRMAEEHSYYTAGNNRLIVEYKGWKICPLICYDLRFPVWSRNITTNENKIKIPAYDLLLYVANWPEARNSAWNALLPARAIENQCYVLGVNRIGIDGKNIAYSGNSALIDAKGNYKSHCKPKVEEIITTEISLTELNEFRSKFPVNLDADSFQIEL
jgi:predicted amidohydrolase